MNNLQGKVKAIPVKKATEGMQVIYKDRIDIISDILKHGNNKGLIVLSQPRTVVDVSELKTLVVEYSGDLDSLVQNRLNPVVRAFSPHREIKQLPLKYSQWQSAIDNDEVDSGKIVEFEIKVGYRNLGKSNGERFDEAKITDVAKIIPKVEEKMYTEEAVKLIITDFTEHCFDTGYTYKFRSQLKQKVAEWFDKNVK